jgi:hypothetical protein
MVTKARGVGCSVLYVGEVGQGVMSYPGIDGTKITIRLPLIYDGFTIILSEVLTITSGAGSLDPTGTFLAHLSSPIDASASGRFGAEFTLSKDPESFKVRLSETAPSLRCTAVFEIASVLAGS